MSLGKPPGAKDLGRVPLGVPKGIPPARQVHERNPLFFQGGDVTKELGTIGGLQGLAVIVDEAHLEGKEDLGKP
jgi:hypothetical protein